MADNSADGDVREIAPIIILGLPHGGFLVKNHDIYNNCTALLFAGSLSECLAFIAKWLGERSALDEQDKP
jgi:hypothetical protein